MTTEQKPAQHANGHAPAQPAFSTEEKRRRYDTGRYAGATGLNWYTTDPSLQRTLRFFSREEDFAWAQPHLGSRHHGSRHAGGHCKRAARSKWLNRDPLSRCVFGAAAPVPRARGCAEAL